MKWWKYLGGSENVMGQAALHFWGPGQGRKVEKLRKMTILGSEVGQGSIFYPQMRFILNLRKKLDSRFIQ